MKLLAARFRNFMQAETIATLRTEMAAMRQEIQAERLAFAHAVEQLRQVDEARLGEQRAQIEQLRKLYEDLDVKRLVDTIDAALLTLAVGAIE